jgi:NAD(P)-dependent dehydrogenase (short-subunit alcohol dehydrogenase family)
MTESIPPRPSSSLTGRVAIVTGAGAAPNALGNGRAAAILLAEDGCSVVCVDLKLDLAQETVDMINADGAGRGVAIAADVTRAEDCQHIVDLAVSTYGRLDILVNNVGIMGAKGSAVDVDIEAFMAGLRVNVASMVQMAKYAIPVMEKNEGQCAGSIVNMSSVAGLRGGTPHILYPTSKGAIVNMTRAMAANHAAQRIRVNCVCPGICFTFLSLIYGLFNVVECANTRYRDGLYTHDVQQRVGNEPEGAGDARSKKFTKDRGKRVGCWLCCAVPGE